MFDFGTTPGQVVDPSHTNIGTSHGQAVVPKIKHIQTIENSENNIKRQIFKNLGQDLENDEKQNATVPYQDNLKTSSDKNYNEPL